MSIRRSPIVAILLVGIAVRIAATAAPGSMWFDELQTAVNATDRDWN
jgi:hypothetical protein